MVLKRKWLVSSLKFGLQIKNHLSGRKSSLKRESFRRKLAKSSKRLTKQSVLEHEIASDDFPVEVQPVTSCYKTQTLSLGYISSLVSSVVGA